jgi:hypothetical protein
MDNSRMTKGYVLYVYILFPKPFANKLRKKALAPNLPTAKVLVTTLLLVAAVAPVNIRVPLFQVGSLGSLLSLNARITPQENKKATVTLFWRES